MNESSMGKFGWRVDNETEALLCQVLYDLWDAQVDHQVDHPWPPPPPPSIEPGVAEFESVMAEWHRELLEHRRLHGAPQFRPPLSLRDLWPRIEAPPNLRPREAQGDDLFFDHFAISQRVGPDEDIPTQGWSTRHYMVAVPTGQSCFRCIAAESSGRFFCTVAMLRTCSVPVENDFGLVRVRSTGLNSVSGRRVTSLLYLYLPSRYGRWTIIRPEIGDDDEMVVGDEADQPDTTC